MRRLLHQHLGRAKPVILYSFAVVLGVLAAWSWYLFAYAWYLFIVGEMGGAD